MENIISWYSSIVFLWALAAYNNINMGKRVSLFMGECTVNMSKTNYSLENQFNS